MPVNRPNWFCNGMVNRKESRNDDISPTRKAVKTEASRGSEFAPSDHVFLGIPSERRVR